MKRKFRKQINRRTMMLLVLFCFLFEVMGTSSVFCECTKTSPHTDFSSSNAQPFDEISLRNISSPSTSQINCGFETVENICNICNTGEQHFIKKTPSKRPGFRKFTHKNDNFGSPILLVDLVPHNYGLTSNSILLNANSPSNKTLSNLRTVVLLN